MNDTPQAAAPARGELQGFAIGDEPCARLLGVRVLAREADPGRARLAFSADQRFCNPAGVVQGGFVAAMLDQCMFMAGVARLGEGFLFPTLEFKVSYLAPVPPGALEGEGVVLRAGRRTIFQEARLWDPEGNLLATSSATSRVRERRPA